MYKYYWAETKGLIVKGLVWDDKYDTWEEMKQAFLNECRAEHCNDKSIREEADKRRENGKKN
ncbi:MAG: hypothetical protein LBP98_02745 [Tannerella sp.]|jgi:hypothetical protein|nr:hypothetical protein [Tannerella sp.]